MYNTQVMSKLKDKGFIVLRNMVEEQHVSNIFSCLEKARQSKLVENNVNSNTSSDKTNVVYNSEELAGMSYCYLQSKEIDSVSKHITNKLYDATGIVWQSNGNQTPVFEYAQNAYVNSHSDWDIGYGEINYIAMSLLTRPNIDFTEGRFYVNKDAFWCKKNNELIFEDKSKREYVNLNMGDMVILENQNQVHGIEPVKSGSERAYRVTVSWRA